MKTQSRLLKILAHRGASAAAPENTMAAFRLAKEFGADGLELDVQLTRDGVPVVIHDERLERTTNGIGFVRERTLEEIRALDAGTWFGHSFVGEKIPTLEEVVRTYGDELFLNIELKNSYLEMPMLEEKTIALIRRYGLEKSVLLSSFQHESMLHVRQIAPDLQTGLLYDCCLVDAPAYARQLGASALHPYYLTVRKHFVETAHKNGLQVNVWTVNDPDHMREMIETGVDAIITNHPDRLRTILDSYQ